MKDIIGTEFKIDELEIDIPEMGGLFVGQTVSSDYMDNLKDVRDEIIELTASAKKRTKWKTSKNYMLPLCDMKENIAIHKRKYGFFISIYKRTQTGIPLVDIKCESNVKLFALKAIEIVKGIVRLKHNDGWCIITTPRRRHKESHFATMVCCEMARSIGIPFYEDVVEAPNRGRIKPTFEKTKEIKEPNIILYDDILTTGSTIEATIRAFANKNIITIIGINNN